MFPEILIIKKKKFTDKRGSFVELWNKSKLKELPTFVQDNISYSNKKGVIRGLHFQNFYPQSKLIYVIKGAINDIQVDIRKNSPTFGHYQSIELSDKNNLQLFIPTGFAHGFETLSEEAIVIYKCTNFYHYQYEKVLQWDKLNIKWKTKRPILSEKDKRGLMLIDL